MSEIAKGYVARYSPYVGATWALHREFADLANEDDRYEFRAQRQKLANRTRVSTRSVTRALRQMVADRFLELLDEGGGRGKAGRYRFLMPDVPPRWDPQVERGNVDTVAMNPPTNVDMVSGNGQGNVDTVSTFLEIPSQAVQDSGEPTKPTPFLEESFKEEPNSRQRQAKPPPMWEDWTPSDPLLAWATEKFPTVDALAEVEQFRDHHIAKGSSLVWDAAFRNWIRNAKKFQGPQGRPAVSGNGPNGSTPHERSRAALEQAMREDGVQ